MTQNKNSERPNCPVCHKDVDSNMDGSMYTPFIHLIREHPKSDITAEIVDNRPVRTLCAECGELCTVPTRYDLGEFYRRAVCTNCIHEKPIRRVITSKMSPEEFWLAQSAVEDYPDRFSIGVRPSAVSG